MIVKTDLCITISLFWLLEQNRTLQVGTCRSRNQGKQILRGIHVLQYDIVSVMKYSNHIFISYHRIHVNISIPHISIPHLPLQEILGWWRTGITTELGRYTSAWTFDKARTKVCGKAETGLRQKLLSHIPNYIIVENLANTTDIISFRVSCVIFDTLISLSLWLSTHDKLL